MEEIVAVRTALGFVLVVISSCVIFFNVTVIVVTFLGKCIDKCDLSVYILSLAISDMVCGLSATPVFVGLYYTELSWFSSFHSCLVIQILTSGCVCQSAVTLVIISTIHYMSACHPILYKKHHNKRVATMFTVLAWITCTGSMTTLFLTLSEKNVFNMGTNVCYVSTVLRSKYIIFNIISLTLFVVFLSLLIFLNTRALQVIKNKLDLRSRCTIPKIMFEKCETSQLNEPPIESCPPSPHSMSSDDTSVYIDFSSHDEYSSENEAEVAPRREYVPTSPFLQIPLNAEAGKTRTIMPERRKKITSQKKSQRRVPYKTIVILVSCFFACLGPQFVFTAIELIAPEVIKLSNVDIIRNVLFICVLANSLVNPIIYAFRLPVYKTTFKKFIFNRIRTCFHLNPTSG